MAQTMNYEQVLRLLVSGFLCFPQNLKITSRVTPRTVLLAMRAHASDKPRLIGKGGKNIWAINTLMDAAANSQGKSARVSIDEDVTGNAVPTQEFVADPLWNRDDILVDGLRSIGTAIFGEPIVNAISNGDRTTLVLYAPGSHKVEEALETIFKAWGRNMGRMVGVECYESREDK